MGGRGRKRLQEKKSGKKIPKTIHGRSLEYWGSKVLLEGCLEGGLEGCWKCTSYLVLGFGRNGILKSWEAWWSLVVASLVVR